MNPVGLPSTYFTQPAHWHWLVILYFFVGGLAGGCYFLATLIDFFGRPGDRPLARLGYLVAFPAVVISGIILIFDLQRPLRFWHMLFQSNTGWPMFKAWSPMSVGSWALLAFGAIAFLSFLAALADTRWSRWPQLAMFRPPTVVGGLVSIIGGLLGFFVAGYTGVLLTVTNRPIWSDSPLLGLVFLVSAASTSAALLMLLTYRRWALAPGVEALKRLDSSVLVLELLALIGLVISLGSIARAWISAWGLLLVLGVVVLGIVVPLLLEWRPRTLGRLSVPASALLVLIGGFLLRVVIVLSSEGLGGV